MSAEHTPNSEPSSISDSTVSTGFEPPAYRPTSFVFTSSRVLRTLRDPEEHSQLFPPPAILPEPPAAVAPSPERLSSDRQNPSSTLTLSQVLRHSEGAITTRSLLSYRMIALGFIQLKPHDLRTEISCLSTPEFSPTRSSVS
ncbi:hypothetical protein C8Q76DRAFT_360503 [Earliella scabrosa]|nr:hypothetical protein C8Q76DRAFT_360503 [Earliella scabrosa]